MTVQEIKNYALLLSGFRDIPDNYVFLYINEAMNDLAVNYEEAGKRETTYLYGFDDGWTELPDNCLSVKRCFDKNHIVTSDFVIENGLIKFDISGEYKVEFIRMNDRVNTLTETPSINALFHDALAYWVAYRETTRIFMHEDINEGNNKIMLFTEFNRKSKQANAKLRTAKKSRKRIKFTPFM